MTCCNFGVAHLIVLIKILRQGSGIGKKGSVQQRRGGGPETLRKQEAAVGVWAALRTAGQGGDTQNQMTLEMLGNTKEQCPPNMSSKAREIC